MNEKQIIRDFLTEIIPSIEQIDGGCANCIEEFCLNINSELDKYGIALTSTDSYPAIVEIIDI